MDASRAKGVLGGIISSAGRELNVDIKPFRIKPGGKMIGRSLISWYATVPSVASAMNVSRNTKKAKELGLIKMSFAIEGAKGDTPPTLIVREWDAAKDWGGDYRTILEASADDMSARTTMSKLFKSAVARCMFPDGSPAITGHSVRA